jgi:hypothetical protein
MVDDVLPVAETIIGGWGQKRAGEQAAGGQQAAIDTGQKSLDTTTGYFEQAREDTRSYRQAGEGALVGLAQGTAELGKASFEMDPSKVGQTDAYKFRVEQGTQAADRAMIAGGKGVSGERIQGLMELGQRMGSQEYEAEFNRQHKTAMTNYGFKADHLNRLAGIAGMGQSSAHMLAGLGGQMAGIQANTSGNIMEAQIGKGDAKAAATKGFAETGINIIEDIISSDDDDSDFGSDWWA